jgi:hypothetical protein
VLTERVPAFLREIQEIKELFEIEQEQIDALEQAFEKALSELRLETASEEGVYEWERFMNFWQQNDTLENRKEMLIDALGMESGVMTPERFKNMLEKYSGVTVTLTENSAENKVGITLSARPDNYTSMIRYLEEILPAHLTYALEIAE